MTISKGLQGEARAFDARIRERIRHGHIPDLRRVGPCDWFYNNPWRRPEFVDMIFGEYLRFALKHIPHRPSRILEVGCGPGHMALELARYGHHVTGLEISGACITEAYKMLNENPHKKGFGNVRYIQDDFLSLKDKNSYDVICFFLSMHHFESPAKVVSKTISLTRPSGRVIVIEPARDLFSKLNAAVAVLIRFLLASSDKWYQRLDLPKTNEELRQSIKDCFEEYLEAREKKESIQSPEDNSSYSSDMLRCLQRHFKTIQLKPSYAFLPRMVGGIRGKKEEDVLRLASFLRLFDEYCVKQKLLHPGAFCFAGRLKSRRI